MIGTSTFVTGCRSGESQQGSHASNLLSAAVTAKPDHVWHMKKAELKQTIGWQAMPQWNIQASPMKDVTAMTMLVPVDWSFQAAQKNPSPGDCNFTIGRMVIVTASPDKKTGMVAMPGQASAWTNDQSLARQIQQDNQQFAKMQVCKLEQPRPLAQKIADLARELNKDAAPSGPMEPVPGAAEKLAASVRQANQQLAAQGSQITAEIGRLPLRSTTPGDDSDGYLTVMQVIRQDRLPSGGTLWTIDYPMQVATFTPKGKYKEHEAMFAAMLDSVWINPEYAESSAGVSANVQSIKMQTKQRLNQIYQQMAMDNLNAARQQAAIRQGVQNYSNQVHANVAANRSAALEHSSQQFAMYMGDQALYHDPTTGGTVQLPSGSTHAWASQTGNTNEYILTDSPSFNPNGQVGSASWSQMSEVR